MKTLSIVGFLSMAGAIVLLRIPTNRLSGVAGPAPAWCVASRPRLQVPEILSAQVRQLEA